MLSKCCLEGISNLQEFLAFLRLYNSSLDIFKVLVLALNVDGTIWTSYMDIVNVV